jgi:Ca-activated chloride channel homolog
MAAFHLVRKHAIGVLLLVIITAFINTAAFAANAPVVTQQTRVLIIFDVSKSMAASYETVTRMDAAKKLAYNIIDSLSGRTDLLIALRSYGSVKQYPPGDCKDSKLVFPFEKGNAARMKAYISGLKPTGITPIAYSLEQSANDFKSTEAKNFIIIITDGIEECNGNICQAASNLSEKGIVLRPFIIGIGLTEEQSGEFQCVGNYFNVERQVSFSNLSNIIITQILNPTSAQVNLLDINGQPSETNIGMTFYDLKDNLPEYNYIHTLNRVKNPDTLYLDVYRKFRINISTVPPVQIDTAEQILGRHNIFAVNAAQGEIQLEMKYAMHGSEPFCVVRKQGKMETLNYQKFNTGFKYLCGTYDLEIMTLPRIYMNNVQVGPEGKRIEIPASGQVQVQSKKTIIGTVLLDNGTNNSWVCNLPHGGVQTYSVFLQPGKYILVYRGKNEELIYNSISRKFTIVARNVSILNL